MAREEVEAVLGLLHLEGEVEQSLAGWRRVPAGSAAEAGPADRRGALSPRRGRRGGMLSCMRIDEAADAYAAHLADVRRLSPATVRAYRSDLADLAPSTGDIDAIDGGRPRAPARVAVEATQRGDARSTIARRTAAARGFFAWAAEQG